MKITIHFRCLSLVRLVTVITFSVWSALTLYFLIMFEEIKYNPVQIIEVSNSNYSLKSTQTQTLKREILESGNIPLSYLNGRNKNISRIEVDGKILMLANNCSSRPDLADIEFSNVYWQMVSNRHQGQNSTDIYAYGAYIDTRPTEGSKIRILVDSYDYLAANSNILKPNFCQIWFPGALDPFISNVTDMVYFGDLWDVTGSHHPYLVTCHLPQTNQPYKNNKMPKLHPDAVPESVSLVMNKCDNATNNLKLNYIVPSHNEDFGVCVRWLDYPTEDLSLRIIEWIEMVRILGAAKIHFKIFAVHPNVFKVLKFYERKGLVTIQNFNYPGFQPNFLQIRNNFIYYKPNRKQKTWRQELIPINDCFYKYMYSYKYIAAIDVDEVIIPVESRNWKTMLTSLNISDTFSPCFKMTMFTENFVSFGNSNIQNGTLKPSDKKDVRGYPYMMTKLHTVPVCNAKDERKCFHSTSNTLQVNPHSSRRCLTRPCTGHVKTTIAYDHYNRQSCDLSKLSTTEEKAFLENPHKYEPGILRFKDELMYRRDSVLREMG